MQNLPLFAGPEPEISNEFSALDGIDGNHISYCYRSGLCTKLYCLVIETQGYEQLAQGCYVTSAAQL